MSNSLVFDKDYYINGLSTAKSNYENYTWLPDLTFPLAFNLINYLDIKKTERILDFGCARGYLVKALRLFDFDTYGFDISEWAIQNCDETIKPYVSNSITNIPKTYDHIIIKDVLEHILEPDLKIVLEQIFNIVHKKILIIVPLTKNKNGKYICPKDELDSTHVIRWTKENWMHFLDGLQPKNKPFNMFVETNVPKLKPMSAKFPDSYGFITIIRK